LTGETPPTNGRRLKTAPAARTATFRTIGAAHALLVSIKKHKGSRL